METILISILLCVVHCILQVSNHEKNLKLLSFCLGTIIIKIPFKIMQNGLFSGLFQWGRQF